MHTLFLQQFEDIDISLKPFTYTVASKMAFKAPRQRKTLGSYSCMIIMKVLFLRLLTCLAQSSGVSNMTYASHDAEEEYTKARTHGHGTVYLGVTTLMRPRAGRTTRVGTETILTLGAILAAAFLILLSSTVIARRRTVRHGSRTTAEKGDLRIVTICRIAFCSA